MSPKVCFAFVLAFSTASLCSAVSLFVLDTLDGGPTAISSDGNTVLFAGYYGSYIWERASVRYLSDSSWVSYYDMTDDAQFLVGMSYSDAIIWSGNQVTNLPLPAADHPSGSALAISGDGSTVVGYISPAITGTGSPEAAAWRYGSLFGLGKLRDDGESQAVGVSADGMVITGRAQPPDVENQWVPFRWEAGVMANLGHPQAGNRATFPHAISPDGRLIVGSSEFSDYDERAFIWENGNYTILPHPDSSYVGSVVNDLSSDGSLLVGYTSAPGDWSYGAIWMLDNGTYTAIRLDEYLVSHGIDLKGFEIFEVTNVSADGSTMAGTGWYPDVGYNRPFIVSLGDAPQWGGFEIRPDGRTIDTGELLGIIDLANAPWCYLYGLGTFTFIDEGSLSESGGWVWFPKEAN